MRKKYFMIADTETIGLPPFDLIFDLGYVIATRNDIILERQFLVKEIITDPFKMRRAYHWDKLFTFYIPQLAMGKIKLFHWPEIVKQFREDFGNYEIDVFVTYNLPFDEGALKRTHYTLGDGEKMLPYKPDRLDLWLFACMAALNSPIYHQVARQEGWLTDRDNIKTASEQAYAFLTGDFEHRTPHTALKDAQVETVILQRLLAKKTRIPYNEIQAMPWKLAQEITQ